MAERNWAGNLTYAAAAVHHPTTLDELCAVIAGARRLRPLGTRHCFNEIADTTGDQVCLDRLGVTADLPPGAAAPVTDATAHLDTGTRTVTVTGGARYGELGAYLHERGWALHNLASLPHICVAGAVATATHGSGDASRNLAGAVVGLELVTADGTVRTLTADDPELAGAVVSLGALGVVSRLTLRVEPTYAVAQEVHTGLAWDAALAHLDELTASADSVSLFTTWRDGVDQVWRKSRVPDGGRFTPRADLFGAVPAATKLHPLAGIDPVSCTEQLGAPGPWHTRLPHFRLEFTPSNGDELQSEYLVPRAHAVAALEALRSLAHRIAPVLQVSEIRTVAGDDLWLSTAHGGDRVALHFTWLPDGPGVAALLPALEDALAPFDARPHWGKLFAGGPGRAAELYPRLADFRTLVERLDPAGTFRNAFLDRHVLGDA